MELVQESVKVSGGDEQEVRKTEQPENVTEHKLHTGWTIWFDKKPKKTQNVNYEDNLVKLGTFYTLEQFWREGVKPMWESFPKGGCFLKKVKKAEDNMIARMWEELVQSTCGADQISLRSKEDILSLWNKDHQNLSLRFSISEKLKEIWELPSDLQIEYKNHSVSMKDRSTYRSHRHQAKEEH